MNLKALRFGHWLAFQSDEKFAMDTLTSAAASGIRARIESLDMLANNIANASSPGFKTDRESFSLYLSQEATDSPAGTPPSDHVPGVVVPRRGGGTCLRGVRVDPL